MGQEDQDFLKDLQATCLKELENHFNSYRDILLTLKDNPVKCLQGLRKVVQGMKANLKSVEFGFFSEYAHSLDQALENHEKIISGRKTELPESEILVFDFFLAGAVSAMAYYAEELVKLGVDSEDIKSQFNEPLAILTAWRATDIPEQIELVQEPEKPIVVKTETVAANSLQESISESKPILVETALSETESGSNLYLLFQNHQQYFAIGIEYIVEVIKTQVLRAPPQKRKNLSGLMNLRGDVLPILNIQEISNGQNHLPTYVVVSQVQDLKFGFQVDAVHQVVTLDSSSFQAVQDIQCLSTNKAISHFCQKDEKIISILKIRNLLAA